MLPQSETEILNVGLDLAMEWGPNWLRPIQERLSQRFPQLTREQLDQYNETCRAAMNYGHEEVYRLSEERGHLKVRREEFDHNVKSRYAWISPDNLSHLFSQGMYYAWKDGL